MVPRTTASHLQDSTISRCLASNWSSVIKRSLGVCLGDGQYLAAVCRRQKNWTTFSGVKKELEKIEKNKEIKGELPIGIGNLSGLTTLLLDSNKLTGFILSTLGRLENLAQLYLEHNNLK
ncbi:hypothetical protein LguiB_018043 [Lonicera macranthoides]